LKKTVLGIICAIGLFSATAQASQTWIVIGDSIVSTVRQGIASQMALNLVGNERDVIFKSVASPGAALGLSDHTGYNNTETLAMVDQIAGYWNAYDGIIVQAGTNDFSRAVSGDDTYASLKAIIAKAKAGGKKVLVMEPIWRADETVANSLGNDLNTYRARMQAACDEEAATCRFARREHTVLGSSAGRGLYDAAEASSGTQMHPNAAGHRQLADWIKSEADAAGFF
jgi:lysophospholipase L1-like esterase